MCFTVKKKGSEKGSQKGFSEGSFQKVPRTPPWRVRPLRRAPYSCLQLEASCLQLSFFAYNGAWEFFAYNWSCF